MPNQDFEKFYFTKVGLGEGCGCAERVIDVHEFNRLAGRKKRKPIGGRGRKLGLENWLRRIGLGRRG